MKNAAKEKADERRGPTLSFRDEQLAELMKGVDVPPLCPLLRDSCEREDCAWWSNGRCAVLDIAWALERKRRDNLELDL